MGDRVVKIRFERMLGGGMNGSFFYLTWTTGKRLTTITDVNGG